MSQKKALVIGSGFAGLSAAAHLSRDGFVVTILEKNEMTGGRARKFEAQGFMFDMGPSWYWMPEVFENFFADFGRKVSDYYELKRLDPSYRVYYGQDDYLDIPAGLEAIEAMFERVEPGSAPKLRAFLAEAEYKYKVGMGEFVQKPSLSVMEFADWRIVSSLFKLQMFSSVSKQVRGLFRDRRLVELLEFPVLFLGATPQKTPALYTLMNYADMALGTWYPMGGMHRIVEGMTSLVRELGVDIRLGEEVRQIVTPNGHASEALTTKGAYPADVIVGAADYHHIETRLLPEHKRNYSDKYWEGRVMAPSCLLYYVGVNKRLKNLLHHNLFFDEDFATHAIEIYESPRWPSRPLFYVSAPSVTDLSVAPEGCENLFILVPVAPGLQDTESIRERYYDLVMERLERITGQSVRDAVVYKRSFAHADFVRDYHAFKGNAYGLANTLLQTAFLKPRLKSRKVNNLYYTGQLTVPGPGVPPSLISGKVVAAEIVKQFKR
ncbi:MAG: phytoene desaturase family protein [Saprospiraceae bacterium]